VADKPLSSITYWNQFVRYSYEQGISIDQDKLTSTLAPFKNQDFIPFEDFKELVSEIAHKSDKPWIGLHFSEKIQISSHGSLGFAVSHGIDLNECLTLISRYYQTRLQAIKVSHEIQNNTYILTINETCDLEPIKTLLYEVLLSSLLNVIEFVIGNKVEQCLATLPYKPPSWFEKYHELLPCPVSFDQASASIQIPCSLLHIPSVTSNRRSVDLATSQCDIELARLSQYDTLVDKVTSLIETTRNYHLSVEDAAKHLNVSKSTLTRKLKLEESSFKLIIENIRKREAKNLLLGSDLSIEAIAFSLGYEDNSNFGRSFKRWFACTPSAFRQRNQP
jgi:AraC-like DNA-binding protein